MKKHILIALTLACVLLLSACSTAGGTGETAASTKSTDTATAVTDTGGTGEDRTDTGEPYHKITADEAKQMIDAGGVTIVDVRTEEEDADGHVPGAILVPLQTIGDENPDQLPDTDAPLIIYCRTGVRSKQASDKLVALGYKNIYDMGGIVDWPYETEQQEE